MFASRVKMGLMLIPIGVLLAWLGGIPLLLTIIALMVLGSKELFDMARNQQLSPSLPLMAAAGVIFPLARYLLPIEQNHMFASMFILLALLVHVLQANAQKQDQGLSLGVTLIGIFYLSWLGAYIVSLRLLPNGLWWILLSLVSISLGDAGAFFIGSRFGKHKLVPHISPHKSVEGYLGSVLFTFLGAVILAAVFHQFVPDIQIWHGIVLGAILGVTAPIGDLAESMLKRQFGAKDSGTLFRSHGGVLDRLDSWLWGAVVAYYVITLIF